jgi:hypothetical protein
MADRMVVNVDSWGSSGLTRGQYVPADLPEGTDLDWAKKHGVIVDEKTYRREHPDWDPEAQAKAEAEAETLPPGTEAPTAAAPRDPEAEAALYADAATPAAETSQPASDTSQTGTSAPSGTAGTSRTGGSRTTPSS